MLKNTLRAFTLVELIVVITIIGILSTVGFVSYSWYLAGARDSNRVSQLTKLSDSLQVYSASRTLPLPDNNVEITASGTTVAYQWFVWVDVLETIDYTNGWVDPKDESFYTYYLTRDRNSLQLMALMEEEQSVTWLPTLQTWNKAYGQFEDRFPKVYGRKLWVLTELWTNTPVQLLTEFDESTPFNILGQTQTFVAHISDDEKIEATGAALWAAIPNAICSRIKQTWAGQGNGLYTINPNGTEYKVYCDMETAGGWWTLLARSVEGGTWGFTINTPTWSITDLNSPYVFWNPGGLEYTELLLGAYTLARSITNSDIQATTTIALDVNGATLGASGITWAGPGFQWEQGMIFAR